MFTGLNPTCFAAFDFNIQQKDLWKHTSVRSLVNVTEERLAYRYKYGCTWDHPNTSVDFCITNQIIRNFVTSIRYQMKWELQMFGG